MAAKVFSIILPTYSGADTVDATLKSIAEQKAKPDFELIIVQDGPNHAVEAAVGKAIKQYRLAKDVNYKILPKNVGRFEARLRGAKLANSQQLLFIDDRVELASDFLTKLVTEKSSLLLGNVIEKIDASANLISMTLSYVRQVAYGERFGNDFTSYDIDKTNFEASPKGTASLFIDKQLFLEACAAVAKSKSHTESRYFNEDTGLLSYLVENNHKIRRVSQLKLYYRPRQVLSDAFWHLLGRGPRFVDYYLKPGTRFFPLLLAVYLFWVLVVWLALWRPAYLWILLLVLVVINLLLAFYIVRNLMIGLKLFIGMPLVVLIFMVGIAKGSLIKLNAATRRRHV